MIDRLLARIEAAFAMDDDTWARHANPWSGLTRLPILPLIALAIWARSWIGAWCLLPIALLVVWAYINPRAFPPPADPTGWLSRAVMGERVLLNAAQVPIPPHHATAVQVLTVTPILGLIPLAWGLWVYEPWAVIAGLVLTIGPKLWFLDRMVWLYLDLAPQHPPYAAWGGLGPDPSDV